MNQVVPLQTLVKIFAVTNFLLAYFVALNYCKATSEGVCLIFKSLRNDSHSFLFYEQNSKYVFQRKDKDIETLSLSWGLEGWKTQDCYGAGTQPGQKVAADNL